MIRILNFCIIIVKSFSCAHTASIKGSVLL